MTSVVDLNLVTIGINPMAAVMPAVTDPSTHNLTTSRAEDAHPNSGLAEVLFEQLGYLIQFADLERDRFDRVRTVLLEAFN